MFFSTSKKNKKSFTRQKLLPILIITIVIIVVLMSVGDLAKLIEETTGKNKVKDLGLIQNCNPIKSLCSISTTIEKQRIRISMNIDEKTIYQNQDFSISLRIAGIEASELKAVYVSLELSGETVRENKQYLRMESSNDSEKNTLWVNKIKAPQRVKDRKDWLATVHITMTEQYNKIKEIQIAYQLHLK